MLIIFYKNIFYSTETHNNLAKLSALYHNTVRIGIGTENRLQGFLIILMEELLLSKGFNFLIQEVQKTLITLSHCSGNGIIVSQGLNAYSKARIGLSPSNYLGVVGGESVSSSVQKCIVSIRIGIILLQLNFRMICLKISLRSGSLGNNQRLSL